ncbi:MAG: Crp/Fnr family transcriptional regulator [Cocleimonas sp.]
MNKTIPLYLHYRNKLTSSPLFKGLKNQTLDKMMEGFRYETWQKNTLSAKLQLKDRFYIIIDGRVEILKVNPKSGKSVVLSILGEGEAFDVISLLNTQEHQPIAVALDDIQLLSVPIEAMHTWLVNYPDFNRNFMPYLAQCMHDRESLISDLALYDTPTRLARLLLRYIETNQTIPHNKYLIPLFHDITHETLARMIGSARQVVNKHLQVLKQEGILKTNEHNWTIERLDALKQKANMAA